MLSALALFLVAVCAFCACLVVAHVAEKQGRVGLTWFLIAAFATPLIALLALLALPAPSGARAVRASEDDALRSFRPGIR